MNWGSFISYVTSGIIFKVLDKIFMNIKLWPNYPTIPISNKSWLNFRTIPIWYKTKATNSNDVPMVIARIKLNFYGCLSRARKIKFAGRRKENFADNDFERKTEKSLRQIIKKIWMVKKPQFCQLRGMLSRELSWKSNAQ